MEAKASRQSASLPIAKYCHSRFFSDSERWSQSWWALASLGLTHYKLRGGCPDHPQKWVCCCFLAVDGPLQKEHPNLLEQGFKKSWNNRVFKMIHMEVFTTCAFDSEHTSVSSFYQWQNCHSSTNLLELLAGVKLSMLLINSAGIWALHDD